MGAGRHVVITVITVAAVLATACSHPVATQAQAVRLTVCGGTPQARPTVVVLSCADNGIIARDLAWSSWGRPVATAAGRAVVDLCAVQDCFNSNDHDYPVVLIAWSTQRCPNGSSSYRWLQYVFAGRSPFQTVPARLMSANKVPQPAQVITLPCP